MGYVTLRILNIMFHNFSIFIACDCDDDTSESPVCDPESGQCR